MKPVSRELQKINVTSRPSHGVLTAAGTTSFQYDDSGNMTADGTYTYDYDPENRLIRVRA